jgi:two-component system, OmpR family, copper resistance phosphate regulon response regulator CusR
MGILIIEDERKTAAYLQKGLTESGFHVDVAHLGEDGYRLAMVCEYDLIVLDVMLPDRDGWSIIKELRERGKHTPVIFLTARDATHEKVRGLELGADDYLVKPFTFSELLARIRSILRRGTVFKRDTLSIEDLEIDFLRRKVTRGGKAIDLTAKEFNLLTLLALRRGEVLSRTLIAEQVWDLNFDSNTNVIDVAIRRLRNKVDIPFERKLIYTVRGVGYVLESR